MVRETFELDSLHCPSCVARIEKAVGGMPGVRSTRLSFATGRLTVEYDPGVTGSTAIAARVTALGYPARTVRREDGV